MHNFSYKKGKLLTNVEVTVIYARQQSINPDGSASIYPVWLDSTDGELIGLVCTINTFIHDLVQSAFIDLLSSEYSVPNGPVIRRGSFKGSFILNLPVNQVEGNDVTISYTDIEKMLDDAISASTLPPPNSNTCYMVYVIGGINVTVPNSPDIVGIEAGGFHNPFMLSSGKETVYCVIDADLDTEGITSATSHELAEVITDPFLNGWFDETGDEVCDACEQLDDAPFHGNLISRFWSRKSGTCIAPQDDNLKIEGEHLTIGDSRQNSDTCVMGTIEGEQVDFFVYGLLDGNSIPINNISWSVDNMDATIIGNTNGNKFTLIVPPAGQVFNVTVFAYTDWGCYLTTSKTFTSISNEILRLQEIMCRMRHEILTYWKFINNPFSNPIRDFNSVPVTISEIRAFQQLSKKLNALNRNYLNIENTGFNDKANSN